MENIEVLLKFDKNKIAFSTFILSHSSLLRLRSVSDRRCRENQNTHFIYLNINQLDALNFIMSLFHASTCFEHMCSSSGGQNCSIQPLVSSHHASTCFEHTCSSSGGQNCIIQPLVSSHL